MSDTKTVLLYDNAMGVLLAIVHIRENKTTRHAWPQVADQCGFWWSKPMISLSDDHQFSIAV